MVMRWIIETSMCLRGGHLGVTQVGQVGAGEGSDGQRAWFINVNTEVTWSDLAFEIAGTMFVRLILHTLMI
jgi:hypothetical protein